MISRLGKDAKGKKRRKLNDGGAEEEMKDPEDDDEDEMIGDFIDDTSNASQFQRAKTLLPGSSGKLIATRANHKKRNIGQFKHDQASAKMEMTSQQSSRDFKTPQTIRNSLQKSQLSGIKEEDMGQF